MSYYKILSFIVSGHPNIKLFIGHGGLLGLQETIAAGVPILGLPVFGDQYLNIIGTVQNGHGEILYYEEINEHILRDKINKMLNDRKYIETARKVAMRFKDRPMKAMDTAVWWTEFVLRHKGADFMKPPKMSYIAYQNFDVYLFLISSIGGLILVIIKLIRLVKKAITGNKTQKKQKKS